MTVEARPVTADTWGALTHLNVREDQKGYVASNVYSIAQAQFGFDMEDGHWTLSMFGIYDDEMPVGFFMYGFNVEEPSIQGFIFRRMVDSEQQGRGYGSFGVEKMVEIFRADERVKAVGISYKPGN
ncbi:MAG TPA: GNAT family N-acetyltransferase, partial [Anaerolineales bacterium]|nr:GNAT family N-acetyltransferase [Anaerolineales bacterium]